MNPLYLSVFTRDANTTEVRVDPDERVPEIKAAMRRSLIFPLFANYKFKERPFRRALFVFSSQGFQLASYIRQRAPKILRNVFATHGLPAIVCLPESKSEEAAFITLLPNDIVGIETWTLRRGRIVSMTSTVPTPPRTVRLDLQPPRGLLGRADELLLSEITGTLASTLALSEAYAPDTSSLIEGVVTFVRDLVLRLATTRNSNHPWVQRHRKLLSISDRKMFDSEMLEVLADKQSMVQYRYQLRDELVQVAAISKTMTVQGFGAVPGILTGHFEPGDFSLLGLGGAFFGLFRLYDYVRQVFGQFPVDEELAERFARLRSPQLPHDPRLRKAVVWREELRKYTGVAGFERSPARSAAAHMLYFSQRLGFRETKISISAAYLSARLGFRPSWSIFTFTHELLHAHVRSLFANLLPADPSALRAAYRLYLRRLKPNNKPRNLLVFFQALLLDVVHRLMDLDDNQEADGVTFERYLAKEDLYAGLRVHEEIITEIAVHILDYQYFYESDANLYLRSIWASWLSLPLVVPRVFEYLFRSICAVAATVTGTPEKRFMWSYEKLEAQLQFLRTIEGVEQDALLLVLLSLRDAAMRIRLRRYFYCAIYFIDAVSHFLVSPAIAAAFEGPAVGDGDDTVAAGAIGVFDDQPQANPVDFVRSSKRWTLGGAENGSSAEYDSLWLLLGMNRTAIS